jgi:hypothetical protein
MHLINEVQAETMSPPFILENPAIHSNFRQSGKTVSIGKGYKHLIDRHMPELSGSCCGREPWVLQ